MAKKSKPSTRTSTYREKYFEERKKYEKQLKKLGKKGFVYYDAKKDEFKSPITLLPEIPKRITKASINALEKAYKGYKEKLTYLSEESGEFETYRKHLQQQRFKGAAKAKITRAINKGKIEIQKREKQKYEEAKREAKQTKPSLDNSIQQAQENAREELHYDEDEESPYDGTSKGEDLSDYNIDEDDNTDNQYSIPDEDFDEDEWRNRNDDYESEEELNTYETEAILKDALEQLENWIPPFWFTPAMQSTQSSRIANAISMIMQALSSGDISKLAKKIEDNAEVFTHALDLLLTSYEDELNQEALSDIFDILTSDYAVSLEDNAEMNDYIESVVGW